MTIKANGNIGSLISAPTVANCRSFGESFDLKITINVNLICRAHGERVDSWCEGAYYIGIARLADWQAIIGGSKTETKSFWFITRKVKQNYTCLIC